jgi:hypothetical protein
VTLGLDARGVHARGHAFQAERARPVAHEAVRRGAAQLEHGAADRAVFVDDATVDVAATGQGLELTAHLDAHVLGGAGGRLGDGGRAGVGAVLLVLDGQLDRAGVEQVGHERAVGTCQQRGLGATGEAHDGARDRRAAALLHGHARDAAARRGPTCTSRSTSTSRISGAGGVVS